MENRVSEIRKLTNVSSWRHCRGTENPADIPTRGLTPHELSNNEVWFNGPSWLNERDRECEEMEIDMPDDCMQEMRADECRVCGLLTRENEMVKVINIENYSGLQKLFRVTAYVLKFVGTLKSKIMRNNEGERTFSSYVAEAELLWIKEAQSTLSDSARFDREKKVTVI